MLIVTLMEANLSPIIGPKIWEPISSEIKQVSSLSVLKINSKDGSRKNAVAEYASIT